MTSGQDSLINGYPITTSPSSNSYSSGLTIPTSPEYSLVGHKDNVCTLDVFNPQGTFGGAEAYLVSGSWDKTAKVWKGWKEVAEFKGHLQAVWSVKCVDEDKILTGELCETSDGIQFIGGKLQGILMLRSIQLERKTLR